MSDMILKQPIKKVDNENPGETIALENTKLHTSNNKTITHIASARQTSNAQSSDR